MKQAIKTVSPNQKMMTGEYFMDSKKQNIII